jgi:RNA polymerase sigma factor (sigma-70 family)
MNEKNPFVFVVDDDASFRDSLRDLIGSAGLDVQTFASASEFLGNSRLDAGCLVLDVKLPGLSGLDLQQELAKLDVQIPIIFITGHGDIPMSVKAMKAGAVEFLTKPVREQDLLDAVRVALERDRARLDTQIQTQSLRFRYDSLTDRERQVMRLVCAGLMNKQVAAEMGVSEVTVKVHRHNVMKKLEARSFADLVRMADALRIPRGN